MKKGFKVQHIEVSPDIDMRYINEVIDTKSDIKQYIESLEDHITELYEAILSFDVNEEWNEFVKQQMILDEERNRRTRI